MTYEPYLSTVRAAPDKGKIIATTLDYPMIMDTFGCTPKFLTENPKAAKALAEQSGDAALLASGSVGLVEQRPGALVGPPAKSAVR